MQAINHSILYQQYSLSEYTKKPEDVLPDYIAFPEGQFRTLKEVKLDESASYRLMKKQLLADVRRLKSLSERLIGKVYNEDIEFYRKMIRSDLPSDIEKPSSLILFKDTRYYLHSIVGRIETFLELDEQTPHETKISPFNRDSLCALFHECLSGINACIQGSSSRIKSAFISLQGDRCDPQEELFKIRNGLLAHHARSFLAIERANGKATYVLGNEVHWYNALYNIACYRFGLDPIIDQYATLGYNHKIISRFERTLPSLMPEWKILDKLTEVFYQKLVSALKRQNKEDWLTRTIPSAELISEIIDGIEEDFITPINLQFQTDDPNKLGLWTFIKKHDDGGYYFSKSRECLQVWLIDKLLKPETKVFSSFQEKNMPMSCIGSKDDLYFWIFESDTHLKQGEKCILNWDNHLTLNIGHLKMINLYSFPKEIRFNLVNHALKNSNNPSDFFEFFLDEAASKTWAKIEKSDPRIKPILFEKLIQTICDNETVIGEVIGKFDILSKNLNEKHVNEKHVSHFFNELFSQALKIKQNITVICLIKAGLCKYSTKLTKVERQRLLFLTLLNGPHGFRALCEYYPINDINSKNDKGETLLNSAVRNGKAECLDILLSLEGIKLNKQNIKEATALMVAAEYGYPELLKKLLAEKEIKANLQGKKGWTALMFAARHGHGECIELLLEHDASSINVQNEKGYTPLMLAAVGGSECCASLLLKHPDIDINKTNINGQTALDLAIKYCNKAQRPWQAFQQTLVAARTGNLDLLNDQLKYAKALIHVRNKSGKTLGMLAAKYGQLECLKVILAQKVIEVNQRDNNGHTMLMMAAANGRIECLRILLAEKEIKANLQQRNNGQTALMFAKAKCHRDCVQALRDHHVPWGCFKLLDQMAL